jgi:hypothetical protein
MKLKTKIGLILKILKTQKWNCIPFFLIKKVEIELELIP